MSFTFNWPRFSDQFHYDAILMLNNALNKGNKPPIIADKIEVVELEMGTEPPDLEIMEIGELTMDQFRGIFRLSYAGDAHLVLKTKVQANPLNHKQPDIHLMAGSKGMLAARQPLVVPMLLRLSHFKLRSIVVLVVSKQKGITLVFKTDPLQNVDINSTFDSIAVIQNFIQREIEGQLRQMFREDLPGIIHRLSQQWVRTNVEAPYLAKRPRPPSSVQSAPDLSFHNVSRIPAQPRPFGTQLRTSSAGSVASRKTVVTATNYTPVHEPNPDLDDLDHTYGLRPEGIPTKSVFTGFRKLFTPSRGLADLREEEETMMSDHDDSSTSFDIVEWENNIPSVSTPPSEEHDSPPQQYETIPAVGGGVITRPRIVHSQSMMQSPDAPLSAPIRQSQSFDTKSSRRQSSLYNPYFGDATYRSRSFDTIATPQTAPPLVETYARPITPDSPEQPSYSSVEMNTRPVNQENEPIMHTPSERRYSISSSSPSNVDIQADPKIVLRPSPLHTTLHQLSTLSHSYHTLSPYTRSLEHFTVRSVPPRFASGPSGVQNQPLKAKRKRTFHLGQKQQPPPPIRTPEDGDTLPSPVLSPRSDAEFDASDMDRYFRNHDLDDNLHHSLPNIHPNHVRLRKSHLHPDII